MHAKVWTAGVVKASMLQIASNFQGSDNARSNFWTCKPAVGAWQARYARASAAQILPQNSAATHFLSAIY
eukprot:1156241-Pelagomonas_calceolata.AAC.1